MGPRGVPPACLSDNADQRETQKNFTKGTFVYACSTFPATQWLQYIHQEDDIEGIA